MSPSEESQKPVATDVIFLGPRWLEVDFQGGHLLITGDQEEAMERMWLAGEMYRDAIWGYDSFDLITLRDTWVGDTNADTEVTTEET